MKFVDLGAQYQAYKEDIDSQIFDTIEKSAFIMGPKVKELEEKLSEYVNMKHGIGVSSGTDALLLSLMVLDIGPGDEVITTPFTFISTGEVIAFLGAKPIFVDIDPVTYNIDPKLIEQKITDSTKAIMPVSLYGQCADYKEINQIAKRFGIPVIEDGAQSFGAQCELGYSCGITDIGCTSFFPSKPFGGYGDGGMIFTSDDDLAEKLKMIRVHGQEKRYHHSLLGVNGRLDALQASILLGKWKYFKDEIEKRTQVGLRYCDLLKDVDSVVCPRTKEGNSHVYAQFSIQVENRDDVITKLKEFGIPTAIHYPKPLHLQPAFSNLKLKKGDFPVSESVAEKIMSLPMHPFLTHADQDQVFNRLKELLG